MSNRTGPNRVQTGQSAFTLMELLTTVSIMLILTVLLLPSIQAAIVRANVSKVMIDMRTIAKALDLYCADYGDNPPTYMLLSRTVEIDELRLLTTPNAYLSKIPQQPWMGQKGIIFDSKNPAILEYYPQWNYTYSELNFYIKDLDLHTEPCVWHIASGGPISAGEGHWYSPSNGLLSRGSFYMDMRGNTNCR